MASPLISSRLVVDSWPILDWIKNRQPATSLFQDLLHKSVTQNVALEMTRINYGEVVYLIRKAPNIRDGERALAAFAGLNIRLHSIDDVLVDEAVDLKSSYPISFADAFAAALAMRLAVPLITGDPDFRRLESDGIVDLQWVGA
jgi:predicted nucleic acid-binding protein